ncbi:MAG TPA: glutathione S-transferase family protein [Minicystis sp.]|nr:glutathione S-transferase family protein [Minicystis sp.]
MRVLYRFPISHFCEKARWNLDAKGLVYELRDVAPGLHKLLLPRGARGTVPVLVDEGFVVGDSTAIAAYLDERYGAPHLLPRADADRARALELEADFGRAGEDLRRVLYGAMLDRPGSIPELLFRAYPAPARALARLVGGRLERVIRRQYRIDRDTRAASRRAVVAAFERLERETREDVDRYLVGGAFSIADLTAAAMLGPLLSPAGSPWEHVDPPPEIAELRAELGARPAAHWLRARWARDRRPAPAP